MLASLGLDSSPAAIQQHLASAPSPFNLASYLTHLSQHLSLLSPAPDLLAAFEAFDENDDGTVDVEELKAALTGMGERMTPEDVDRALKGFTRRRGLKGRGGGGEVFRYTEFVDLLAGKGGDDEDSEEN
jgi:myosin regulatory light chain 12